MRSQSESNVFICDKIIHFLSIYTIFILNYIANKRNIFIGTKTGTNKINLNCRYFFLIWHTPIQKWIEEVNGLYWKHLQFILLDAAIAEFISIFSSTH